MKQEKVGPKNVTPSQKQGRNGVKAGIIEAVEEMKLIKTGKKKARNAEDFLNGL